MNKRTIGMLLVLGLGCRPVSDVDGTDDKDPWTDPDGGYSGRLYDVPMRLTWAWTSQEGEGACLDLKVATNGADVRSWRLMIETDVVVSEIYYVEGADIRWVGDRLSVAPSIEPSLDGGEELLSKVCARPGPRLVAMEAEVAYVDAPDTDPPSAPQPFDMLLDPGVAYGLQYAEDGMENGGRCLRFDVINFSAVPVVDWGLRVTMSGSVARTASEGLWFYEGSRADELVVLPDHDSRTIQGFDSETGRVCLNPFAVPVAIRSGEAPTP